MIEINHNAHREFSIEEITNNVPDEPGIFMLSVRLVSGVHQVFHTRTAENLRHAMLETIRSAQATNSSDFPKDLQKFRWYYTYAVVVDRRYRQEFEQFLAP